jgi:hypothetical protein
MAQQIINVGASPNDGDGDPIRTSFIKTNQNFTELYNQTSGVAVPGVYYVAPDGNDANNGQTLSTAFASIKAGATAASTYTALNSSNRATIFVKTGNYTEDNPVSFGPRVTVWGDNLRSVSVYPLTPTSDIFHVRSGCYIAGLTFRGHVSPSSAIAYPSTGTPSNNVITTSPYVQNCSSITTTGTGMRVDGSLAGGLKSMVTDSYTQVNEGGIGIHILNQGYAQLVSIFTICTEKGIWCESGGTCSVSNSNSSFGLYGLVADGAVPYSNPGFTDGVDQTGQFIELDGLAERPSINQAISFDGGVTMYDVWGSTSLVSGACVVEISQPILTPIPDNTPVDFYIRSVITASSHTFEYIGTGTSLANALPATGAQSIPANEVLQTNYGEVIYTSTDQRGNFKVGDQLTINGATGTISGETFDKSLFAVLTPYILAIEG